MLLFPGFCCLVGVFYPLRKPDLQLSAVPEMQAQSPMALAFIVGGSLCAHVAGAGFFAWLEWVCEPATRCTNIVLEPNPYTALISESFAKSPTGPKIFFGLAYLTVLGALTGVVSALIASTSHFQSLLRPSFAHWLYDLIKDSKQTNRVVIAHVLSNLGANGVFAGYVGAVESIKLDRDGEITSVSLSAVDRFSVIVGATGMRRASSPSDPMEFLHITRDDISNLNFELFDFELVEGPDFSEQEDPFWPAFWSAFTLGWASPS